MGFIELPLTTMIYMIKLTTATAIPLLGLILIELPLTTMIYMIVGMKRNNWLYSTIICTGTNNVK